MDENEQPRIAQRRPYVFEMEPGEYHWCACGHSQDQPFCDGSHAGTKFRPQKVTISERKMVAWCGCKRSQTGALCDGAHTRVY